MPKLWTETVETHRREVHVAIQDRTAALVAEQGLRQVTMSQIAEATGIGRATLYKYYRDVEAILIAWHQRQIAGHLHALAELQDKARDPEQALEAVLEAYAFIRHQHHGDELATLLHQGPHVMHAEAHLRQLFSELIGKAANARSVRDDVSPEELAQFCVHALGAAAALSTKAAVRRLVAITLAGLRRPK